MSVYLVTGGAGFIGSHLVDSLIERGNEVVILDNTTSLESCCYLKNKCHVKFYHGSILDNHMLQRIGKIESIDGIFHLAAIASVKKSIENPYLIHHVNCTGTLKILEYARKHDIDKIIFSASAAAYGNSPEFPKTENMNPDSLSPYASSKIASEMYLKNYSELYGMRNTVLRYFNVYGPRQDPNGEYAAVVSKFINNIASCNPITIYGDGEQTRDFVYVKDVANANILAMNSSDDKSVDIFNIGTGIQTSLNDLAQTIMRITEKTVPIIYGNAREGDVRNSCADISKAEKILGYRPHYTLEQGLLDTLKSISK